MASIPRPGVAIVSKLHFHLVRARRQRGETTGDPRLRPLHRRTLPPAHKHNAVIVSASQVRALDGENLVSYTKGR